MTNEDLHLVERTLRGEREAFGHLVKKYEGLVYNLTYRMTGSREEAADMAQEAFLRAYRSLASYNPEYKFTTWICKIASHACIDHLRRQRTRSMPDEDLDRLADGGESLSAHEEYERAETGRVIREALATLPEKYRTVLVLRYMEDMTYEDIAETLDIPLGTVKTHLRRARLLLQEKLSLSEEGVLGFEMC